MPNIIVPVSSGALARITTAGQVAGFSDGPSYVLSLIKDAVLTRERGNAAAAAATTSDASVSADFAST